jgi:6-phosphogluconolactonase
VPLDDERSNQRMAHRALLDTVPVRAELVLSVDTALPPAQAATAYEACLRTFFDLKVGEMPAFDLVFLGIGADGHTASLFPGMPAIEETDKLVVATPAPDPAQPLRISVTLPVLNAARTVVFLAQGADKAAVIRQVLGAGVAAHPLPAQRVHPTGQEAQLCWFIDEAAAAGLR